jgi:hypothetical protein
MKKIAYIVPQMKELNLNTESDMLAGSPTGITGVDELRLENEEYYMGEGRSKEHFDVWE